MSEPSLIDAELQRWEQKIDELDAPKRFRRRRIVKGAIGVLLFVLLAVIVVSLYESWEFENRKSRHRTDFLADIEGTRARYDVPEDVRAEAESALQRAYSLAEIQNRYEGPLEARSAEISVSSEEYSYELRLSEYRLVDRCFEGVAIRVKVNRWRLPPHLRDGDQAEPVYSGRICVDR